MNESQQKKEKLQDLIKNIQTLLPTKSQNCANEKSSSDRDDNHGKKTNNKESNREAKSESWNYKTILLVIGCVVLLAIRLL